MSQEGQENGGNGVELVNDDDLDPVLYEPLAGEVTLDLRVGAGKHARYLIKTLWQLLLNSDKPVEPLTGRALTEQEIQDIQQTAESAGLVPSSTGHIHLEAAHAERRRHEQMEHMKWVLMHGVRAVLEHVMDMEQKGAEAQWNHSVYFKCVIELRQEVSMVWKRSLRLLAMYAKDVLPTIDVNEALQLKRTTPVMISSFLAFAASVLQHAWRSISNSCDVYPHWTLEESLAVQEGRIGDERDRAVLHNNLARAQSLLFQDTDD